MNTLPCRGAADAMSNPHQQTLTHLLSGMQETTHALFATGSQDVGERHKLLLGLELLWKLEEQVVMPALQQAAQALAPEVVIGAREIDIMRDLSLRSARSTGNERAVALAALEGLARLHAARSRDLMARTGLDGVDWHTLHQDVVGLRARWKAEIRSKGEIEDEERDPVGLPPR